MERNRNLLIAFWVGIVLAMAVVAWVTFVPQELPPPNEVPEPVAKQIEQVAPRSLRQELQAGKSDAKLLAERLEDVLADKLLEDPEIRRLYRVQFSRFSAQTLAQLTVSKGAYAGGGVVQQFVANSDDVEFVLAYFRALGEDLEAKRILLQHLGSDSTLLVPSEVVEFLAKLPDLSDGEWRALGSGLQSRVQIHTKEDDAKIASLNAYLAVIEEPEILRKLATVAVRVMPTDEAIAWLKEGEFDLMAAGDRTLMRTLQPSEYDKGFDLLNHYIEDGQIERAQNAIEGFLPGYAAQKPREALAWVRALDHAVITDQMRATAFRALYKSSPEEARAVLEATKDPDVRSLYESHLEAAEKAKEREAARVP